MDDVVNVPRPLNNNMNNNGCMFVGLQPISLVFVRRLFPGGNADDFTAKRGGWLSIGPRSI
jgi:hypothetical protein